MMDDQEAVAAVARLNAMLLKNEIAEAEQLFASFEKQLPDSSNLECRGNIEFHKKHLQQAVNYFEAAIGLAPHRVIARYQYIIGTQEEMRDNFEEAIKRYASAIDAEPSFVDAYIELGGLFAKRGQYEMSAQCYRDAIRVDPEDTSIHYNLVAVLSKLVDKNPSLYSEELTNATREHQESTRHKGLPDIGSHKW
jgi:tetratricopeptide (TPR) repeat protein